MLPSAELRWFYPGTVPQDVRQWFEGDCPGDWIEPPETREDVYLFVPGSEFLNLKHRQGRMELKWRKAELGVLRFGDKWEGRAEQWVKWLCEDPGVDSMLPEDVLERQHWIAIQKTRSRRMYRLDANRQVEPVPPDRYIECGGGLELTQLTVKGQSWWSLGFEVFGETRDLSVPLEAIAHAIAPTYNASPLKLSNSYAYPTLMSELS